MFYKLQFIFWGKGSSYGAKLCMMVCFLQIGSPKRGITADYNLFFGERVAPTEQNCA
jgi:hypothetical protein